jgi:hypothetical protein
MMICVLDMSFENLKSALVLDWVHTRCTISYSEVENTAAFPSKTFNMEQG